MVQLLSSRMQRLRIQGRGRVRVQSLFENRLSCISSRPVIPGRVGLSAHRVDGSALFQNIFASSFHDGARTSKQKDVAKNDVRLLATDTKNGSADSHNSTNSSSLMSFSSFSKEASTAPIDFDVTDRWKYVLPANMVHLSIGSVYVYSMWTPGMTTALGVVSNAPLDWTHSQVLPVFSAAAVTLGVTTSFLGTWVEKSGPRTAGAIGSLFWSAALTTTAVGVHMHSLPLVYLGYGLFGGIGWGLMYLAPVTTVMKFFPDKRGLATGISLSAFGVGAALAPSLIDAALDFFFVAPEFIGPLQSIGSNMDAVTQFVDLTTLSDGSQVVSETSQLGTAGDHAVVATDKDLLRLPQITSGPGVYAIESGNNGTAQALGVLGIFYGVLGTLGSRLMKVPHPEWVPVWDKQISDEIKESSKVSNNNEGLEANYVTTNTLQYPLLWLAVFGNATGGLALLSSSKLMMTDIWADLAPDIVTSSFATGYVSSLGIGMALGRFGWAAMSDKLGRKNTYTLFGLGIPIVGLAPTLCHASIDSISGLHDMNSNVLPMLATFYGGSIISISFYGGIFSVLPAYIADLFGQKHAGSIHGKALTAWAASAVAGPMGLAYLRSESENKAIHDLLQKVENKDAFERTFGCAVENVSSIHSLIDAKTLSISRLLDFVPKDTVDPTPFLYDSTLYVGAGLMGVALLANLAIQPLDMDRILSDTDLEDQDKSQSVRQFVNPNTGTKV